MNLDLVLLLFLYEKSEIDFWLKKTYLTKFFKMDEGFHSIKSILIYSVNC